MNIILFDSLQKVIPLKDYRAQHIVKVLKLKEGDTFKMGIVNQSEGTAEILSATQDGISISYKEECKPSLYPVTLLVAQVRPICMKRILREAVSLGVEKIVLTTSETGEKSYAESKIYTDGEYKDFLLDGAMQSAHAGIPDVVFASSVEKAVSMVKADNLVMLDNVTGSVPLSGENFKGSVALAIGPERGWTDRERKIFVNAGFKPMLLGLRVLRTETACSAGVAVLLSRMGLL